MRKIIILLILMLAAPCGIPATSWSSLGPEGGNIAVVAVDPQNPSILYAGSSSGTPPVFKSVDSGASWMPSAEGLRSVSIRALVINSQNSSVIYAGTSAGVFKTTDGGTSWYSASSGLSSTDVLALVIDPVNPSVLYAGAGGLFKSTNGGSSWTAIPINSGFNVPNVVSLAIDPQRPNTVYVGSRGTGSRLHRTTDGGASWSAVGPDMAVTSIAVDPANSSTIFILSGGGSTSTPGVYKSTDGGTAWTQLSSFPVPPVEPLGTGALVIDPQTPSAVYVAGFASLGGAYKTVDGGANWVPLGLVPFRSFCINPRNPSVVYGATDGAGVYKSLNAGGAWSSVNSGLNARSVNSLAGDPRNPGILYAADFSGVFKSADGGMSWNNINSIKNYSTSSTFTLAIDPQNSATVYVGSGRLYKSTDGGITWSSYALPNGGSIHKLAINPEQTATLYAGTNFGAILKSTDGGANWTAMSKGLPDSTFWNIVIDPQNADTLYAGGYGSGVFKSTDGGANWTAMNSGLSNFQIYTFAINPQKPDMVYVGTRAGIFKTADGGASWSAINHELGDAVTNVLVLDPQNPDTLYAGTYYQGIFRTVNGGASWTAFNENHGFIQDLELVRDLAIDPVGNRIYAGMYGHSIWVSPLDGSSLNIQMKAGGAVTVGTPGSGSIRSGYAQVAGTSGATPYGTAVFSFYQNGAIVSEAGVPASPPTRSARIFIDYRSGVNAIPARGSAGVVDINTGISIVNYGAQTANVTYTLRDQTGASIASGNGTIEAGKHLACFINRLKNDAAPNFNLPADFQGRIQFGSLDITTDQPLSVLALRGTTNQLNEFLMTTTPVADLSQAPGNGPTYFPQFVDGGGYTTSLILLNTSSVRETGKLEIRDKDGNPLAVNQVGGTNDSSFNYSIEPGGVFRFQTDGFPADARAGWVRLTPAPGTQAPVGSGVFAYNQDNVMVSESGVPAAAATTHARVYVDRSGNHNTGLALANVSDTSSNIVVNAFQKDGVTAVGNSRQRDPLPANGYVAAFADGFVTGLPEGFTGVLDISSTVPFAALTLRSLDNERGAFLMTTFPVADVNQAAPSPVVFPHIVDGGGYTTQFILLSPVGQATTTLRLYGESGSPMEVW